MAKVIWTSAALHQLEAIAEFIALDKPNAASAVVKSIFDLTDQAEKFKYLGRKIPDFPNPAYRQLYIKPCWMYYRIDGESIYVLHVRRGEQLFNLENIPKST